jgi:hypothetical protein
VSRSHHAGATTADVPSQLLQPPAVPQQLPCHCSVKLHHHFRHTLGFLDADCYKHKISPGVVSSQLHKGCLSVLLHWYPSPRQWGCQPACSTGRAQTRQLEAVDQGNLLMTAASMHRLWPADRLTSRQLGSAPAPGPNKTCRNQSHLLHCLQKTRVLCESEEPA